MTEESKANQNLLNSILIIYYSFLLFNAIKIINRSFQEKSTSVIIKKLGWISKLIPNEMSLLATWLASCLMYLLYKGDEIKSRQAKHAKCTFIHLTSSHPSIHSLISPINTKCNVVSTLRPHIKLSASSYFQRAHNLVKEKHYSHY